MSKCNCALSGLCETHGRTMTAEQHRQCREVPGMFEAFASIGERKRMPPIGRRIANATKAAARAARAAVACQRVTVDADTLAQRRAACRSCDQQEYGWCGKCGCALGAKQRFATETCPLGRWPTDNSAT